MITIEKIKEFGANTDEGVARCMGNEEFYLKLVATVPEQKEFDELRQSVAAGQLEGAFEAAHALKGVLGNLSITPLYDKVCEITELLRAKTDTDYSGLIEEITALQEALKAACE